MHVLRNKQNDSVYIFEECRNRNLNLGFDLSTPKHKSHRLGWEIEELTVLRCLVRLTSRNSYHYHNRSNVQRITVKSFDANNQTTDLTNDQTLDLFSSKTKEMTEIAGRRPENQREIGNGEITQVKILQLTSN